VSAAAAKQQERTSGAVKSAILLLSLGYEQCAELLKLLTDEQVRQISEAIASLGDVSVEQTETVLEEFVRSSGHGAGNMSGGLARARRILAAAFGQEVARKMVERLPKRSNGAGGLADFSSLEEAEPERLANFLGSEHPQTIALVLAHLKAETSCKLLEVLPEELRVDVTLRLASLDGTSPEVVGRIAQVLDQKVKALGRRSRKAAGGVRAVADLLNRIEPAIAELILAQIEQKDEKTAKQIRALLFVFEDLMALDAKGLKELIGKVDRKVLTIALKGTSEELQAQIFGTMSKRGAEMMREDMEALGPVKIREVEGAQAQIIEIARGLEKEGVLSLTGADAEQYVV
jgi:flagellar motor switch protein FliG